MIQGVRIPPRPSERAPTPAAGGPACRAAGSAGIAVGDGPARETGLRTVSPTTEGDAVAAAAPTAAAGTTRPSVPSLSAASIGVPAGLGRCG